MPEQSPQQTPDDPITWLLERWRLIAALLVGGVGAALVLGVDLDLPRWAQVMAAAGLLAIPIGFASGSKVASLLHTPNWVYIVELDTRKEDNALYRIPSNQFGGLDVTGGKVDRVNPHLVFAQNVDLEAGTLEGVWRGTLSDRELMSELYKVHELRGTLEEDARKGFAVETQAWMIVREATRDAVVSIVDTFEHGMLPGTGESVNAAIDSALENYNLEELVPEPGEGDSDEDEGETTRLDLDGLELDEDDLQPEVPADD